MKTKNPKKLKDIAREFRILKKWNIKWGRGKYRGQAFIYKDKPKAIIYPWGKLTKEPKDYRLHEVLHCALRSLLRIDKRKTKQLLLAEEELIQDICKFYVYKQLWTA